MFCGCSEYVAVIQRYVETRTAFKYGTVAHALAAALDALLQDWALIVTQFEHQWRIGNLTLSSLVYQSQGMQASLRLLASIAGEAAAVNRSSASLLNLLHNKLVELAGRFPSPISIDNVN